MKLKLWCYRRGVMFLFCFFSSSSAESVLCCFAVLRAYMPFIFAICTAVIALYVFFIAPM